MAERTRTCYTLVCDSCGHDIEVDNDGVTMHFPSADEAREQIETCESGVAVPGVGDYCNRCKEKPHPFIASEESHAWLPANVCRRCEVNVSEHPPVVEPVEASDG